MLIYLLRHAIAVDRGTPGYERDSDRPLTRKGRKRMRAAAAGMRAMGVEADLLLTSPYLRARETAAIVAEVLGAERVLEETDALAADREPQGVVEDLRRRPDLPDRVLLVGHEPMLSAIASLLLCGEEGLDMTLKKGGLCCLSVDHVSAGRCARLEWLMGPRHLEGRS